MRHTELGRGIASRVNITSKENCMNQTGVGDWICKVIIVSLLLAMASGCAPKENKTQGTQPAALSPAPPQNNAPGAQPAALSPAPPQNKAPEAQPAVSSPAPQEEWVTCSSHPDVRFRRGESCPKCGMHGSGGMGGMH